MWNKTFWIIEYLPPFPIIFCSSLNRCPNVNWMCCFTLGTLSPWCILQVSAIQRLSWMTCMAKCWMKLIRLANPPCRSLWVNWNTCRHFHKNVNEVPPTWTFCFLQSTGKPEHKISKADGSLNAPHGQTDLSVKPDNVKIKGLQANVTIPKVPVCVRESERGGGMLTLTLFVCVCTLAGESVHATGFSRRAWQ